MEEIKCDIMVNFLIQYVNDSNEEKIKKILDDMKDNKKIELDKDNINIFYDLFVTRNTIDNKLFENNKKDDDIYWIYILIKDLMC